MRSRLEAQRMPFSSAESIFCDNFYIIATKITLQTKMHASQRARNRNREGESQREREPERERSSQSARESARGSQRKPQIFRMSWSNNFYLWFTQVLPECGSCQQPCRPAVVVHIGYCVDWVLHLSQPGYQVEPTRIFTFVKPSRISSQVNQDIPFLPIKYSPLSIKYSPLSRLFPISKASAKLADQI